MAYIGWTVILFAVFLVGYLYGYAVRAKRRSKYDVGWMDGWNACRSTDPELRVFMTEQLMKERG
jgi:hypothetical protein